MITAFAGSKAAEKFLQNVSIKWGFGAFAIIMPFVTLPTFILLKYHIRKAEKNGIIVKESSGRTLGQNVWHYIVEFDGKPSPNNNFWLPLADIWNSSWCLSLCCWTCRFPAPIHARCLRPQRLEERLHHCHDCRWVLRSGSIRCL